MESDLEEQYVNENSLKNNNNINENTENVIEAPVNPIRTVKRNASGFLPHESVEIASPAKERILSKVRKQHNKYWHFQFKNDRDLDALKSKLESVSNLNVMYNFEGQNKADVTLLKDDKEVGKIHFLLCDRRDSNLPAKYYVKLYFFNFTDEDILNKVKEVVSDYFNNVIGSKKKGGKHQRTYKKRTNHKTTRKNIK